jgi:hypothetical protein
MICMYDIGIDILKIEFSISHFQNPMPGNANVECGYLY